MKRQFKFTAVLIAVVMFLAMAVSASAASYWQQKHIRFSAIAGETLDTGDVACIKASDGKAYQADANDSALRPAVGVIDKGGASGSTVEIVVDGVLAGQEEKSPGATLYLSETAGGLTATAPANEQTMGWVLPPAGGGSSSTRYFIRTEAKKSPGAGY